MDLNLAFLAARPVFDTGLDARESYFRSLPASDRQRPSVPRMLEAIDGVRKALRSGKLEKIVVALAELDSANNACVADGLPGRDVKIIFPSSEADNEPGW